MVLSELSVLSEESVLLWKDARFDIWFNLLLAGELCITIES